MSETRYNTVNGRMGIGLGFMMLTAGLIFIFESFMFESGMLLAISFGMFLAGGLSIIVGARELDKIDRFLETIDHE